MAEVPVKSVNKALDLLSILIFDDPGLKGVKLTDLAQRLKLPANTTHNLLKTMMVCGYVCQKEVGSSGALLTQAHGPRHRCDWAKRYNLHPDEGPALIGNNTRAEIPDGEISIEQLSEGCKAKDPRR